MTPDDAIPFSRLWESYSEVLAPKPISPEAVALVFKLLSKYALGEVVDACEECAHGATFMFTPAHIVQSIEKKLPDSETLIGAAREQKTPIGRFLNVKLGVDLANHHPRQLVPRVNGMADALEDLYQRALIADYTDVELRMFLGSGVDITGPIAPGAAKTRKPYRQHLARRMAEVGEALALAAPEPMSENFTPKQLAKNRQRLADAMRALDLTPSWENTPKAKRAKAQPSGIDYRAIGERVMAETVTKRNQKALEPEAEQPGDELPDFG